MIGSLIESTGAPRARRLSALLRDVIGAKVPEADPLILGLEADSGRVEPGAAFVAIHGTRLDGHAFVPEAVGRGARAVVVEREVQADGAVLVQAADTRQALAAMASAWYGHPASHLLMIGVTGTNGKTTVCHLIRAILAQAGEPTALLGNVRNIVAGHELMPTLTTPDALTLHGFLARAGEGGDRACVMEVTSHALALGRVWGVPYRVAVFTNLSQDHLDFHGDLDAYLETKCALFRSLPDAPGTWAVVNADDPRGRTVAAASSAPVLAYGQSAQAEVRAESVTMQPDGAAMTLHLRGSARPVRLRLVGRCNVQNALAASAAGIACGVEPEAIVHALEAFEGVPGRFERVDCGQPFDVWVDYAHTPDSLAAVLHTGREMRPRRLVSVFGCGGDRDKAKRPFMGRISGELADLSILTSDNPRSEAPEAIIAEIERGLRPGVSYEVEADRRAAIARALALARRGDLVIIAGKGHETYQEIGDRRIAFSDRKVVEALLTGEGEP